jgi:geranylgeranyl pyrophosphate synthase
MTEPTSIDGPMRTAELDRPPQLLTPDGEQRSENSPYVQAPWSLAQRMGLEAEIDKLRAFLATWIDRAHPEIREMLGYQLSARSKYFRPVTMFACRRASGRDDVDDLVAVAAAAELLHNYATVVDDIVDRDRLRRGKLSLHVEHGPLGAQMTAAYLGFGANDLIADDPYSVRLFAELGQRVAAMECRQWRLRRHPLGVDVWREIAGEDTGAMFEACARAATRDASLARYGYLLGTLYHGCDDVADIRGALALGAHSDRDISDRILTLPAAIATRDPDVARLFSGDAEDRDAEVAARLTDALPEAERILDVLADDARAEAARASVRPEGLVELVRFTRELSST